MPTCRSCLSNSTNQFSIFTNIDEPFITPALMFNTFFPYTISEDDGFPLSICRACTEKLQAAYTFLMDFSKVQQTLLDIRIADSTARRAKEDFEIVEEQIIIETSVDNIESEPANESEIPLESDDTASHQEPSPKPKNPKRTIKESIPEVIRSSEKYICPLCDYNTDRYRNFDIHISHHKEPTAQNIKCMYCAQIIPHANFAEHSKKHRYPCNKCDRNFKTACGIWYHRATTHKEFKKEFKCTYPKCKQTFLWEKQRIKHAQIHSKVKKYLCAQCGQSFKTYDMYRYHITRRHEHRLITVCEECGKQFVQHTHYLDHMWVHRFIRNYGEDRYDVDEKFEFIGSENEERTGIN